VVNSQPRLVIAGTRSGDGKTTVGTGLMAALRTAGLHVSGHKVGPDYIDPSYHAAATGRPGRNLDPWLTSEDLIAPLFRHGAAGTDISVVEGVMGLFDGAAGRGDFASTAHVARLLDAPIILVVSAAGAGRSIAATVHGFARYDPAVRVAAVVLNQVSSPRHEQILREALADIGMPVAGALPAEAVLHTPSRHLGLVPAAERASRVRGWLPALTAIVAEHLDLDLLTAIARTAPPMLAETWSASFPDKAGLEDRARSGAAARVAIAGGPAFTFGYAEHRELLAAAGAEVADFDPLTADALPDGTDALIVDGGFPELYAAELAANEGLRADVARRVAAGMPVIAECAGLLWLASSLAGHPQCAALPVSAQMSPKLTLGYREAVAVTGSPLAPAGTVVRAHEFHRTTTQPARGETAAWRLADGTEHGWATPSLLASYLHVHWAGLPPVAHRLVAAAQSARAAAT
jgi:cobyrinic acid a,c-diamide synthase